MMATSQPQGEDKNGSQPVNRAAVKTYTIGSLAVLLLYIVAFLIPFRSYSQEYPRPEMNPDELIQHLFGQPEEEVNYEDLYESLFGLYAQPLDLNRGHPRGTSSHFFTFRSAIECLFPVPGAKRKTAFHL